MYVFGGKRLVLSALARAMTRAGYEVHVSHVSRVFKGERVATKNFVHAMARVIGVTPRDAEKMIHQAQQANKAYAALPEMVEEGS